MKSAKCDGCGKTVNARTDWLFLYDMKVFVCNDCADKRFDSLYDRISFDWWENRLEAETEARKLNIIGRLGALSPTALIEQRERIAHAMMRRSARG